VQIARSAACSKPSSIPQRRHCAAPSRRARQLGQRSMIAVQDSR
jgi:hypothetical protein